MKHAIRSLTLWLMPFFLGLVIVQPAHAQEPDPKFDSVFTQAKQMESASPDKAFNDYLQVSKENNGKNQELAGEALLRAVLLGYNNLLQPQGEGTNRSPEAQNARQETQLTLAGRAHNEALHELVDGTDFAATKAGQYARAANWQDIRNHQMVGLREALESEIDRRNSHIFSYQMVDGLVRMTGSIPAFSYWFALLLIAILVKGITYPLTLRMYKSQREMQRIQPMVQELQAKYKGKPELGEKLMALYKEHSVNPAASCLPLVVQMPFLIWVYNTIRLYEYHFANGGFLWIGSALSHKFPDFLAANLGKFDVPLLILYASSNYVTVRLTPSPDPAQAQQQKSMALMMTGVMFFMFLKYRWSAAFIFYWLVLNLVNAAQQYYHIYLPNRHRTVGAVIPSSAATGSPASIPPRALAPEKQAPRAPGSGSARPRPKPRK